MEYIELKDISQISQLKEHSTDQSKGVLIFKHSTRCAISKMALNRFERGWNFSKDEFPVYFLDLIRHRDVSDAVSREFNVQHESPQILLIQGGVCNYSASHNAIVPDKIEELFK